MNSKLYLTTLEYAATGEGLTIQINICQVKDKEEARKNHLNRFNFDPRCHDYFGKGIKVEDALEGMKENRLVYQYLTTHLIKEIIRALEGGAQGDFYFGWHINYS